MKLSDVVEQYMIDCENRGRAYGTLALYRRDLGLLVRWLEQLGIVDLEAVTLALLRQFLNFLINSDSDKRFPHAIVQGRLTPSTVGTYVSVIKAFFQWCAMEDLIASSPAARLAKPKVPEKVLATFTPEHVEKMLAACDLDTRTGFRDYVILLVLLDTGMRVSELCNLRLSDVHPRHVKVFGKGQKEREIGLHPDVSKVLWKYINKHRAEFGIESDRVFVGERGPLTAQAVDLMFKEVGMRAGVVGVRVSPHTMRHTFSKQYLKNGGDLFKLSRTLGHSDIQVTGRIYLSDFKSEDARLDHDRYSPVSRVKLRGSKDGKKSKRRR
jgi:integrase/recombinase XerD